MVKECSHTWYMRELGIQCTNWPVWKDGKKIWVPKDKTDYWDKIDD
jgi:hypothetical protein